MTRERTTAALDLMRPWAVGLPRGEDAAAPLPRVISRQPSSPLPAVRSLFPCLTLKTLPPKVCSVWPEGRICPTAGGPSRLIEKAPRAGLVGRICRDRHTRSIIRPRWTRVKHTSAFFDLLVGELGTFTVFRGSAFHPPSRPGRDPNSDFICPGLLCVGPTSPDDVTPCRCSRQSPRRPDPHPVSTMSLSAPRAAICAQPV